MKRTFEDAQIRSPRKAILTFINNQIGAQISQGEQVAVISDLVISKWKARLPIRTVTVCRQGEKRL